MLGQNPKRVWLSRVAVIRGKCGSSVLASGLCAVNDPKSVLS